MSVASVHRIVNLHDTLSSSYNYHEPAVLSIEELRTNLYSCFTCGVCWLQDHVCLDCAECGGYSLQRPCPDCDGRCGAQWKRDLTLSHACGKARWTGACLQALNSQMPSEEQQVCTNLNKMSLNS